MSFRPILTFTAVFFFALGPASVVFAIPESDCDVLLDVPVNVGRSGLRAFINRTGDFNLDAPTNKSIYFHRFQSDDFAEVLQDASFRFHMARLGQFQPRKSFMASDQEFLDLWLREPGQSTPSEKLLYLIKRRVAERLLGSETNPFVRGQFNDQTFSDLSMDVKLRDYVEEPVSTMPGQRDPGGPEIKLTVIYEVTANHQGTTHRFVTSHITEHQNYAGFDRNFFLETAVNFEQSPFSALRVRKVSALEDPIDYSTVLASLNSQVPQIYSIATAQSPTRVLPTSLAKLPTVGTADKIVILEWSQTPQDPTATQQLASLLVTGQEVTGLVKPKISFELFQGARKLHAHRLSLDHQGSSDGRIWYSGVQFLSRPGVPDTPVKIDVYFSPLQAGRSMILMRPWYAAALQQPRLLFRKPWSGNF